MSDLKTTKPTLPYTPKTRPVFEVELYKPLTRPLAAPLYQPIDG